MSSTSFSQILLQIAAQYSLYSGCIISVVGLISNVLNLLVFTKLKIFRDNRCVLYLTVEAISNLFNQIFTLINTTMSSIYGEAVIAQILIWCRLRHIIFQTTTMVTYYMICFAACDQFCSTNYRLNLRQICTFKLTQYLVILTIFIWFLHSILFCSFVGVHPLLGCVILNPIWMQYSTFFFYPVLQGFLPIIIASFFSLLAFGNVRRIIRRQIPIERRRFDHQITAMVLVRVVLFVILSSFYTMYRIYAINRSVAQVDLLRSAIERLIQAIFYSISGMIFAINFYLFLISSSRYRRQVKYVLKRKYWQQIKNCCSCANNQVRPDNTQFSDENVELE